MRGKQKRILAQEANNDERISVASKHHEKTKPKLKILPKFLRRQPKTNSPLLLQPALEITPPKTHHYFSSLRDLRMHVGRLRVKLDEQLAAARNARDTSVPPKWAELFIDGSYSCKRAAPEDAPVHVLHLAINYCACLSCMASDSLSDEIPSVYSSIDFDGESVASSSIIKTVQSEATLSHSFRSEAQSITRTLSAATTLADMLAREKEEKPNENACLLGKDCNVLRTGDIQLLWQDNLKSATRVHLPSAHALRALCHSEPVKTLVDLGTVKRGVARFTGIALSLAGNWNRYFQGTTPSELLDAAYAAYPSQSRSATARIVCDGFLYRFGIDAGAVPIKGNNTTLNIAVCYRRQPFVVLEGNISIVKGISSVEKTNIRMVMGFGEDARGACDVFRDGTIGEARHLGLNELLVHVPLEVGEMWEVVLR